MRKLIFIHSYAGISNIKERIIIININIPCHQMSDMKEFLAYSERPKRPEAMLPRRSFKEYPRPDSVYKHKSSFNFDMMRTRIFVNRRKTFTDMYLWLAHGILGIIMATITFSLTFVEDKSAEFKSEFVQKIIDKNNSAVEAWLAYTVYGMSFVLVATLLTIYFGPGANGSGVAEIMGMLNGVNYPKAIGLRTLITKCVGTVFAVSGGLTIGKEGPLAHIGANVGAMVCQLPIRGFYTLRNDVIKR